MHVEVSICTRNAEPLTNMFCADDKKINLEEELDTSVIGRFDMCEKS